MYWLYPCQFWQRGQSPIFHFPPSIASIPICSTDHSKSAALPSLLTGFPAPSGGVPSPHLSCFPCDKLHVGVRWLPEYVPQIHSILPLVSCGSELQVDDLAGLFSTGYIFPSNTLQLAQEVRYREKSAWFCLSGVSELADGWWHLSFVLLIYNFDFKILNLQYAVSNLDVTSLPRLLFIMVLAQVRQISYCCSVMWICGLTPLNLLLQLGGLPSFIPSQGFA